jgi:chitodextrinase
VACVPTPSGTTAKAVSAAISGLVASTKYRVRVVATNNSGTGNATDQAFTTLADTCAGNPALCPPPEEKNQITLVPPVGVQLPGAPIKKPLKCHKGFKKKTVHGKPKCVKARKPKRRHI